MPNECINDIVVYADTETIKAIVDASYLVTHLLPPLEDQTSATRIAAYGTERFYNYKVKYAGPGAIRFSLSTSWAPPLGFLKRLVEFHEGIVFLKSDWTTEDGVAGVWVADRRKNEGLQIQQVVWDEGCLEERYERFRKDGNYRTTK